MNIGVFVLGAPRSGTTWLQAMLGAHPEVVSPQETSVVPQFLAPWTETFDTQVTRAARKGSAERVVGLPVVLTRDRFRAVLRGVLDEVADAARALKPGARVVVEKTPDNAHHVDLIRWLEPDARFVHIVRDGRDVVASLLAASASWGGHWAPSDVHRAAQVWKDHVLGARDAAAAGDGYTEVRYDALLADGPGELVRVFAHCGIDASADEATTIYEQFRFEHMATSSGSTFQSVVIGGEAVQVTANAAQEPDGFYRVGRSGSWEAWGDVERWAFDEVAGDLLVELGFEPDRGWAAPLGRRHRAHRLVSRRRRQATRASRRMAGRIARRALRASTSG